MVTEQFVDLVLTYFSMEVIKTVDNSDKEFVGAPFVIVVSNKLNRCNFFSV